MLDILVLLFVLMSISSIVIGYGLPAPAKWVVLSDENEVVFRVPRIRRIGALLAAPFFIIAPFGLIVLAFGTFPLNAQNVSLCIIWIFLGESLAYLFLRSGAPNELHISLTDRTYAYRSGLPQRLIKGSLNDFEGVYYVKSSYRVFCKSHPPHSGKDVFMTIGFFKRLDLAQEYAQEVAAMLDIPMRAYG